MRPLCQVCKPCLYKNTKQRLFALVFRVTAEVASTGKDGQGLAFHLDVKFGRLGKSFVGKDELAITFGVGEIAEQVSKGRVGACAVFVEGVEGVVVVVPATDQTLLFVTTFVAAVVASIVAGNKG